MGLGIYEQSLLLFTNASEDVITKSEARERVLHYKTYTVRQNKRSSRKPLHSGHLQTTETGRSSQAVRYMEVPLYFLLAKGISSCRRTCTFAPHLILNRNFINIMQINKQISVTAALSKRCIATTRISKRNYILQFEVFFPCQIDIVI